MVSPRVNKETAVPITTGIRPGRSIVVGFVLTPIRKKRNMRPNEATVSITIMPLVGNKLEAKRSSCPRREGPNIMPP